MPLTCFQFELQEQRGFNKRGVWTPWEPDPNQGFLAAYAVGA
jgi:hypothetical protein